VIARDSGRDHTNAAGCSGGKPAPNLK
jgi:hypothetical protein